MTRRPRVCRRPISIEAFGDLGGGPLGPPPPPVPPVTATATATATARARAGACDCRSDRAHGFRSGRVEGCGIRPAEFFTKRGLR